MDRAGARLRRDGGGGNDRGRRIWRAAERQHDLPTGLARGAGARDVPPDRPADDHAARRPHDFLPTCARRSPAGRSHWPASRRGRPRGSWGGRRCGLARRAHTRKEVAPAGPFPTRAAPLTLRLRFQSLSRQPPNIARLGLWTALPRSGSAFDHPVTRCSGGSSGGGCSSGSASRRSPRIAPPGAGPRPPPPAFLRRPHRAQPLGVGLPGLAAALAAVGPVPAQADALVVEEEQLQCLVGGHRRDRRRVVVAPGIVLVAFRQAAASDGLLDAVVAHASAQAHLAGEALRAAPRCRKPNGRSRPRRRRGGRWRWRRKRAEEGLLARLGHPAGAGRGGAGGGRFGCGRRWSSPPLVRREEGAPPPLRAVHRSPRRGEDFGGAPAGAWKAAWATARAASQSWRRRRRFWRGA